MKQYRPDTTCIHAGYTPGNGEPRVLPIVQSTTYTYDSSKEMGDLFDLKADGFFYTRLGNPTLDAVEKEACSTRGRRRCARHVLRPGSHHDGPF